VGKEIAVGSMKAVVCDRYGPPEVLRLEEVAKPVPKDNEVLIKIRATTVHVGDSKIRRLSPGMGFPLDPLIKVIMLLVVGFRGPRRKILGMEFSGVIEETGRSVTRFNKGDEVCAGTEMLFGAYAEYICLPEDWALVKKPVNMTHEEAAALPNGGLTALLMLRKAGLKSGQKILIYGASGSVGTFAVQLAKNLGAEVTGVCSGANLELVRSLGADKVIDYTVADFMASGETYDVIFDAVGKLSRSRVKGALKSAGRYYNVLTDSGTSMKLHATDLEFLKDQVEAGKLRTVIDRKYTLAEMVEAHRYVDLGHKKGNVVVTVSG
jgi:NADPH:quinone reductase-like Zn-dependent oxidoreductase